MSAGRNTPIEFGRIGLSGEFKKVGPNEWHGACVFCGGKDRFRVLTSRPFPHWYAACRPGVGHCGWSGWVDQINPALREPLSAEKKRMWAEQQQRERTRVEGERLARLAEYSTHELWVELHRRMAADQRQWWRDRGIPDDWQDFLSLGYTPDKLYYAGDEKRHSPAYTIPYFHDNFAFQTMQYRLTNPANPNDRYRFEAGLPATYYQTNPNAPIGDKVILCEGAKKAIVTAVMTGVEEYAILAAPSKTGDYGLSEALSKCGLVYVLYDPDAEEQAHDMAKSIGQQARCVILPEKVDDAFAGGMTQREFAAYLRQAVVA